MINRKPFGQVIEGEPLEMRRLTSDELVKYDCPANTVGIFRIYMSNRPSKLLGYVLFDCLFDEEGSRFKHD